MVDTPLAKKLGIKPGHSLLILDAPDGYLEALRPLPEGVTVATSAKAGERFDVVQRFVTSADDVATRAAAAIAAFTPNGLLWFAYPKKTGAIKTDISRDRGWEPVGAAGFLPVTQIAIDETWSALRFRPRGDQVAHAPRAVKGDAGRSGIGTGRFAIGLRDRPE